jgi:hypothetical protein
MEKFITFERVVIFVILLLCAVCLFKVVRNSERINYLATILEYNLSNPPGFAKYYVYDDLQKKNLGTVFASNMTAGQYITLDLNVYRVDSVRLSAIEDEKKKDFYPYYETSSYHVHVTFIETIDISKYE